MKKQGFSLVELMVVIAIVAILSAIAVPTYRDYKARAYMTQVQTILESITTRAIDYANTHGYFPNISQLNLPADASSLLPSLGYSYWGWGDSCGKNTSYAFFVDTTYLGLQNVISNNTGMACDLYNINGVIKKNCTYWERRVDDTGWYYGNNLVPGLVNQYEGNSATASSAVSSALLRQASCM